MTKNEYNAWLQELSESSEPAIREIAAKASSAAWYLDTFVPCDGSFESFDEAYPGYCEDADDFAESVRLGWITLHDGYAAVWADGSL